MPDAIERPEPRAWLYGYEIGFRPASVIPPDCNAGDYPTEPLYTRADVIAWARRVIAAEVLGGGNAYYTPTEAFAYNDALHAATLALDAAAKEWEESDA